MFVDGNRANPTGRPRGTGSTRGKRQLHSEDILLPVICRRRVVCWESDFARLYKKMRGSVAGKYKRPPQKLTKEEAELWKVITNMLPYLVTKINIKDIDLKRITDASLSVNHARKTFDILKQLEEESILIATKPGKESPSDKPSVGNRQPVLPPTQVPEDNLPQPTESPKQP